ncbi:nudix hydrolase 19, chloroplastic isoform X1 [Salvia splendens]|uniref:nudix hydrolase 19, chloroplastic isoform X1 n=1 Tax=Salvia splendens TaxID=180675 RepID=UPI0011032A08|nr:nudix hydrolase 19, chloroplastic isoform X1 [Salvia splendens]
MLLIPSPSSVTTLFSKTLLNLNSRTLLRTMTSTPHAFAGNPIRSKTPKPSDPVSPQSAIQTLKTLLISGQTGPASPDFRILPFRKGRPLAGWTTEGLNWHLGWLSLGECKAYLENSEAARLEDDAFVYLGCRNEIGDDDDVVYWAVDVSEVSELVNELGARHFCFVELRTLMVATDWADSTAMGYLAIAGHARALLEWHNTVRFCGYCGCQTVSAEAGRRKQCSNESCKKRIYPRVDPVVIMLVIDKDNDCVLLSRQSRFVPRMWSCLAGFIEPGESLEEAVKRETWEETGIEVGEVVYHSSQPWPVGPGSMPCQLMVGFFAYAKTFEINVDKEELEDAKWHSREDVTKALTFAEYKKAQMTAAAKVEQMCKGVEKGQNLSGDFNVESGELATMFIPGPFAIAHHLISSWVNRVPVNGIEAHKQASGSLSNL